MDILNKQLIDNTEKIVSDFKVKFENILKEQRGLDGTSNAFNSLLLVKSYDKQSVSLLAVDYMYYVVHGRGPGKMPPPDENGNWPLPYPVAKKIAMFGNIAKYKPVANSFDAAYEEMLIEIDEMIGNTMVQTIKWATAPELKQKGF